MSKYVFAIVFVWIIPLAALAQTTKPIPQIDHVIIISIDGLRPDVLLRADAPTIRSMMARGCFTFWGADDSGGSDAAIPCLDAHRRNSGKAWHSLE